MSEERFQKVDRNSMLYWWPKVKELGEANIVPMPKTLIYEIPKQQADHFYEDTFSVLDVKPIKAMARKIGYPLFMRTDQASGKHEWEKTCYVPSEKVLVEHLYNICVWNWCADIIGLRIRAIVVREYIPMASKFTAFIGRFPVSPERRYFVKDGEVVCHHAYWIEEAIEEEEPSTQNWRELSKEMNEEKPEEVECLTLYAREVGSRLPSVWSVDFCKATNNRWYFIDAALATDSWHPEACPHYAEFRPLQEKDHKEEPAVLELESND